MSRSLAVNTQLKATLGAGWTVGSAAKTVFAWVKHADFGTGTNETNIGFLDSSNTYDVNIWTRLSGDDRLVLGNLGDANLQNTVTAGAHDGAWIPICAVFDTSANYFELYRDTDTSAVQSWSPVANALTQIAVGHTILPRAFNIAHLTYWDRAITSAEYTTLITPVGGKAPNPTTLHDADILSYWSFETDSLVANEGSDLMTLAGSGSTYSSDDPDVDTFGVILTPDTASYSLAGTEITLTYTEATATPIRRIAPPGGTLLGINRFGEEHFKQVYSTTQRFNPYRYGTVSATYQMQAETRAFGLSGTDVTLTYGVGDSEQADEWFNGVWWARPFWGDGEWWADADEVLSTEAAAYTLTGADVTLTRTIASPVMEADLASYAITFNDATLTYVPANPVDVTMTAEPGTYSITGTDVSFKLAKWVEQATVSGTWTIIY